MDSTMYSTNSYYVFPAAIVLGVLSAATIALDILPFVWHFRNRNVAACSLVFWILILNLCSLINVFLWPNDNTESWPDGRGLCDVEAKIFVGSFVALTGALLCIMRSLARVMDTENTVVATTRAQRRRAIVLDLFFCFGLPLYTMIIHYVVQPSRYYLWGISGCSASVDNSWVFIVLIVIPPLLLSLADAYYSGLVIFRLHRYRLHFSRLLAASNTTKSRFMRLFIMSQILIFAFVPIQVYIFYLNMQLPLLPYSWNEVHSAAAWAQIVMIPSFGTVLFDRWIRVVCGFLVFVFFGVGADAVLMYKSWLLALGCGRIFPSLKREGNGRSSPKHSLGSWGEKAKLVLSGKRHRGAASSRSL
ncbi:a-pheromone receptor PreA [Cryomyces antarcticus]